MAGTARVTKVGAYAELDPDNTVRVTKVGAYVELRYMPRLQTTKVGAYVELRERVYREVFDTQLLINGVDYAPWLRKKTLSCNQPELGEIGTLQCELEDSAGGNLPDFTSLYWSEIYWRFSNGYRVFGGYLTSARPRPAPGENHLIWELKAESWMTRFAKAPAVRKSYTNMTHGAIFKDMLTESGIVGFDTSQVRDGDTLASFSAVGGKLTDDFSRLAATAGLSTNTPWTWFIRSNKDIILSAPVDNPAPFAIVDIANADWWDNFPCMADTLTCAGDTSDIRNRVTVRGGSRQSDVQTANFTGTGAQTIFQLAHRQIVEVVSVTKSGALQSYGVDWYDDPASYNCLVDYSAGMVKFTVAPAAAAAIVVKYRYGVGVSITRDIEDLGFTNTYLDSQGNKIWFDFEVEERSITNAAAATALADAMLLEYGFPVMSGGFSVNKLRLEPGQSVLITSGVLGLNSRYLIRSVRTEPDPGGTGVIAAIKWGGRVKKFSGAVNTVPAGQRAGAYGYQQPTATTQQASNELRRIATAISYTAAVTDFIIAVTDTTASRTITLPTAPSAGAGRQIIVKDESGGAGAHAITVNVASAGTIDGVASKTIARNYGSLTVYSDGTRWLVMSNTADLLTSLNELADVAVAAPAAGQTLVYDNVAGKWENVAPAFLALADVPADYVDAAGMVVKVNATEDALEFGTAGGSITVKEQDGTPTVASVTEIRVTNGTLTDEGAGIISLDFGSAATDGSAIHDNVASEIHAITEKTTPVDADELVIEDSADSYAKKRVQIGNLPGGGGGNVTYRTALASPPASANDGDLWMPTDSPYLHRYLSSAWVKIALLEPLNVPPSLTTEGGANGTVDTNRGTLYIQSTSANPVAAHKAKTWGSGKSVTIRMRPGVKRTNNSWCSFGFSKESDGQMALLSPVWYSNTYKFYVWRYSNWVTWAATYTSNLEMPELYNWWQLYDDGTNRIFRGSSDGRVFYDLFSQSRTDTFTPDGVVVLATNYAALEVFDWVEV